ncbi:hypothetical protein [Streptomyces mangrovi]|uniref:hypothetical protein n=1 Tax=Streptomyces mangrovi TaxID=1206892 RepID=UPI00399C7479
MPADGRVPQSDGDDGAGEVHAPLPARQRLRRGDVGGEPAQEAVEPRGERHRPGDAFLQGPGPALPVAASACRNRRSTVRGGAPVAMSAWSWGS